MEKPSGEVGARMEEAVGSSIRGGGIAQWDQRRMMLWALRSSASTPTGSAEEGGCYGTRLAYPIPPQQPVSDLDAGWHLPSPWTVTEVMEKPRQWLARLRSGSSAQGVIVLPVLYGVILLYYV
ncbi:hypothetical protein E2562_022413 [Oryza meyeriana var. granulata]|uniref:Uncharacterized protein n=1 Tax=Oryza meyeriana var. granulata TaxID=110450 RepID=A0A6G1BLC1_9ORYZ|nr:hypothetical protein E2562_022413 [Oryza meyeriana var. granulata]